MNRKGIKRIGLMSLLVLSLLIFAPAGRAQAAGTGTVKNRVVNVRSNATTASSIVAKLTQGTSVSITSETTGSDGRKWYNVSFKYNGSNKTGCILSLIHIYGALLQLGTGIRYCMYRIGGRL